VDLAATTTSGMNALHGAAGSNKVDCVLLLLERGADPTALDGDGKTAWELSKDQGFKPPKELRPSGSGGGGDGGGGGCNPFACCMGSRK
jgi:Ankyrin repeats (many copies)